MKRIRKVAQAAGAATLLVLAGCAGFQKQDLPIDRQSVLPGTEVQQKGTPRRLLGTALKVGDRLPAVALVDAMTGADVDLSKQSGQVLFLSIVPSIDTKVCEQQTHYLGEEGDRLPDSVARITISRDTPFAQKRFAEEAKLTDLQYLSDYKEGAFGRATGLLADSVLLLARSVVVVDADGVVRYLQVVPEMTHLPDMDRAFAEAAALVGK